MKRAPGVVLGRLSHSHNRRIILGIGVQWRVRLDADTIVMILGITSTAHEVERINKNNCIRLNTLMAFFCELLDTINCL